MIQRSIKSFPKFKELNSWLPTTPNQLWLINREGISTRRKKEFRELTGRVTTEAPEAGRNQGRLRGQTDHSRYNATTGGSAPSCLTPGWAASSAMEPQMLPSSPTLEGTLKDTPARLKAPTSNFSLLQLQLCASPWLQASWEHKFLPASQNPASTPIKTKMV